MKRLMIAAALGGFVSVACAQGYAGAVRSLTRVALNCPSGESCDTRSKGMKLYAGTKLSPSNVVDFGIGKVEAVELAYMSFGKAVATGGTMPLTEYDEPNDAYITRNAPATYKTYADALAVALVARMPVSDEAAFTARFGLAYVSSTYRTELDGRRHDSKTETRLKPYIGLGFEYAVIPALKLVGTYDKTTYDADGRKASLSMFGLGAEASF